jgi:hypothetical protein
MAFPVRVEIKLNRTAALEAHAMLGMWENKRAVYAWHARAMWIGLIFRLESTCLRDPKPFYSWTASSAARGRWSKEQATRTDHD